MIILMLFILLAMLTYDPSPRGAYHFLLLVSYVAAYAIPLPVDKIRRVVGAVAPLVLVAVIIAPWNNSNVMAMWVWALFFFAEYDWAARDAPSLKLIFGGLCAFALYTTGSEGGALAMLAGFAVQYLGQRGLAGSGLVTLVVVWSKRHLFGSFTQRLYLLADALQGCLRQLLGHGLGSYEYWRADGWGAWHAHNLIADVGYTLGIGGLAALMLLAFVVWRADKPRWTIGFLVAFLVHSMVDGPIWYGPGLLLFITLKEVRIEHYLDSIWRGIGRYVRGHRPGPTVAGETPLGVDTRATDTVGAGVGD